MTRLVRVYKGARKRDSYLFVDYAEELSRVPQALLDQFGEPEQVLSLKLTADRKLARADAAEVLKQIKAVGFYLQLPPADSELQEQLQRKPSADSASHTAPAKGSTE